MCGRYQLTTEENIQEIQEIVAEINRRYMDKPILSQMKLGEIRPTDIVPVIANSKSFEPKPFLMQWGFSGFGDKPKPIINAVSETALTKNMFRKPLLERRCLIPASHFYEWQDTGYRKVKHVIKTVEPMIYMAGIRNGISFVLFCFQNAPPNDQRSGSFCFGGWVFMNSPSEHSFSSSKP